MNSIERPPAIVRWTLRLEEATTLDRPVKALEPSIRSAFGTGTRTSVLRGEWLGHAVHPLLTDVVLGTRTSAPAGRAGRPSKALTLDQATAILGAAEARGSRPT